MAAFAMTVMLVTLGVSFAKKGILIASRTQVQMLRTRLASWPHARPMPRSPVKQFCKTLELNTEYSFEQQTHTFTSMINGFNLSRAGFLNLLVLAYPKIKIVPLCLPPNKKYITFVYPQIRNSAHIVFWRTPCDLLAYLQG